MVVVSTCVAGSTVVVQSVFASTCVGGAIVAVPTEVATVTASEKVAEAGMLPPTSTAAVSPMRVKARRVMLMLGLLSRRSSGGRSGVGEHPELGQPGVRDHAAAGVPGDRLAERGDLAMSELAAGAGQGERRRGHGDR